MTGELRWSEDGSSGAEGGFCSQPNDWGVPAADCSYPSFISQADGAPRLREALMKAGAWVSGCRITSQRSFFSRTGPCTFFFYEE